MSSQPKHPCEISSLKSTSGLLNSFGNWKGCSESLCAGCLGCLRFSVRCRPARLCRLPLRWLPSAPRRLTLCVGSAKENQTWEAVMHKMLGFGMLGQNHCWWSGGMLGVTALPGCPWQVSAFGVPLGPCASATTRGVGSAWPFVSRMRTADRLLHPLSLRCMVRTTACRLEGLAGMCLRSADSWKDQAGFSSVLTSIIYFFFFWFFFLIFFNSETQLRRKVFPVQRKLLCANM